MLIRTNTDSIYIVTTKDLVSVQLILESRGIYLDPEHMFQATKTLRKPEILMNIVKAAGCSRHQFHFIDDHPATVLEVAEEAEGPSYCAAWGYNTLAQLSVLDHPQIQILNLERFKGLVRNLGLSS